MWIHRVHTGEVRVAAVFPSVRVDSAFSAVHHLRVRDSSRCILGRDSAQSAFIGTLSLTECKFKVNHHKLKNDCQKDVLHLNIHFIYSIS